MNPLSDETEAMDYSTDSSIDSETVGKLRRFYREHQRMPSYSELASLFGYASKQAAYRLAEKCLKAGFLKKDSQGRLLPSSGRLGIPLAGYVQAGFPSPAEEDLVDSVTLDQYLIQKPEASFMLKVTGDSMIDAGIMPEDLVVVERGKSPKNGDVVLAQIDREWTLKYYRKEGKVISLIPANAKYPVLIPKEELSIAGVITAVVRKYR